MHSLYAKRSVTQSLPWANGAKQYYPSAYRPVPPAQQVESTRSKRSARQWSESGGRVWMAYLSCTRGERPVTTWAIRAGMKGRFREDTPRRGELELSILHSAQRIVLHLRGSGLSKVCGCWMLAIQRR